MFEAAIPPGHQGFVDAYWPQVHPRELLSRRGDEQTHAGRETQLVRLLPDVARSRVALTEANFSAESDNDGDREPVARLTAALELRQLDYHSLFRLVANADLGLDPCTAALVYVIDETDPLILLMYDDRGAILIAPTSDRLRTLYESFGDWLVDSDRQEIDQQFAGDS